jgi:biotin carboxyl carrier protein
MTENLRIKVNGRTFEIELLERERSKVRFKTAGRTYLAEFEEQAAVSESAPARPAASTSPAQPAQRHKGGRSHSSAGGAIEVAAPIPGVVTAVLVSKGSVVEQGDALLRIEAMKMENSIFSPAAGTIIEIAASPGDEVGHGQVLALIKPK